MCKKKNLNIALKRRIQKKNGKKYIIEKCIFAAILPLYTREFCAWYVAYILLLSFYSTMRKQGSYAMEDWCYFYHVQETMMSHCWLFSSFIFLSLWYHYCWCCRWLLLYLTMLIMMSHEKVHIYISKLYKYLWIVCLRFFFYCYHHICTLHVLVYQTYCTYRF